MKDCLWLVKTDKGDFSISVIGNWTEVEAVKKLRQVLDGVGLSIIAMVPRKRATLPMEASATIYEQEEPYKDKWGFSFLAGKKFWVVCGRGVEYEAEMVRFKKEMSNESSTG